MSQVVGNAPNDRRGFLVGHELPLHESAIAQGPRRNFLAISLQAPHSSSEP